MVVVSLWVNGSFLFLSGSDGCHLFSLESEDEPARAGTSGSIQFSPETQHEKTDLNRHVDTLLALQSSPTQTQQEQDLTLTPTCWLVQTSPPLSLKVFISVHPTSQKHVHTDAASREVCRRRGGESHISVTAGETDCIYSTAHMHSPSSPFIRSSSLSGEELHQLMFFFTVIG